ncbi:MAG: signal peptide peptidase SppA [Bacteroidota bacterium]
MAGAGEDKPFSVKEKSVLHLKLNHEILDRGSDNPFENFNFSDLEAGKNEGLNEILEVIKLASEDKHISGIFLDLEGLNAGMASTEEIRNALMDFKKKGKWIMSYSEMYTQKSYYLASVADQIFLNPKGDMEWKGISAELPFFKGTMEKLEIEPQIIRHGKFKSAVEPFILDKMSNENRLQTRTYVGGMWNHLLQKISQSRKINSDSLQQFANRIAIRKASDALRYGMVDGLKYRDEVMQVLAQKSGSSNKEKEPELITINQYSRVPGIKNEKVSDPKIAIIYASGEIESGKGANNTIGSEPLSKAIRQAREDDKIKAIVLRINSPGGSALASEIIWRETQLAAKTKPLVVSMGDVAASGGYYIAAGAKKIFASPTTITGSIGVFGMMLNAKGMLNNKLGITMDTINTGRLANIGSIARPLTAEERNIMQEGVEDVYRTFISRVSEGRGIPVAEVDSIGQGRVWCGIDAINIKLVDEFGGLNEAVSAAAKLAGVKAYRLTELPKKKNPLEAITSSLSGEGEEAYLRWKLGADYNYVRQITRMKDMNGIMMLMPEVPQIY